jgi:hypothetical protein
VRHLQVIVPITVLAVYHAFAYCAKTFPNNTLWQKYGVRAHSFLAAHQVPHTLLHLHLHCCARSVLYVWLRDDHVLSNKHDVASCIAWHCLTKAVMLHTHA